MLHSKVDLDIWHMVSRKRVNKLIKNNRLNYLNRYKQKFPVLNIAYQKHSINI